MTTRSFSVIHGHHIYKEIWTLVIVEVLTCDQEHGNLFAISFMKKECHVGHAVGRSATAVKVLIG